MAVILVMGGLLLGILAWIDIQTKKVPLILIGVLAAMMLSVRIASFSMDTGAGMWFAKLSVGLLPGGISLFCSYITKGQLGIGDGLILAALGLGLEFRNVVLLWVMAFCMAAVLAMFLLILKKARKKTEIPFVPFLFLGYTLCWIIGV